MRNAVPQLLSVTVADDAVFEAVMTARWQQRAEGLSRAAYSLWHKAQMRMPWGLRQQRTLAMLEDGVVRASAEHYDLAGVIDGRPVPVCALGSIVGADPAAAGALIDATANLVGQRGVTTILLFIARDMAARIPHDGVIAGTDLTLHVTESTRYGAPMTTVRVGEERDLPAIAAMGQIRGGPFRFRLDRDVEFLRYIIARQRLLAGLGPIHRRQLHFFIAEEGITAAAYVVIDVCDNVWTLEECGDRDPTGARVGALLQALIAREPSTRRPTIRGWLPQGFLPPQVTITSSTPSPDVVVARLPGRTHGPSLTQSDSLYWRSDRL